MTGFLTGVGVLIILGQLWDLTGYSGTGSSKIAKTIDLIKHITSIDIATTVIGLGALVLMFALGRTKLVNFNLLIALAGALFVAWIFRLVGWDSVALVKGLGDIPRSIPTLSLPAWGKIPAMIVPGIAVGAVGLVQAAGVAQRYPNPGGRESHDSRDFFAQGVANAVCGFFQGMPGGGPLSGTALNVQSGARTRWALIFQAIIAIGIVLIFSDLLGLIPMAALVALLIYVAISTIKIPAIKTVLVSTRTSALAMIVTFIATLVIPLEEAVLLGVILAAVMFLYRSSTDVRVVQIIPADGGYREVPPPKLLASETVTILDVYGSLFYAGARKLSRSLPSPLGVHRAAVVLRVRGHGDLDTTFLDVVSKYADRLRAEGGELLLSGVDPEVKQRMAKTGHLDQIGSDRVFVAGILIGRSTKAAFAAGQSWLTTKTIDSELTAPNAGDGAVSAGGDVTAAHEPETTAPPPKEQERSG